MIWDCKIVVSGTLFHGSHFVEMGGWWSVDKVFVTIINVYAPVGLLQKKELWKEIIQVCTEKRGGR